MKKLVFILLVFVTFSGLKAQECNRREEMRKKFEAHKVAFITQELDLTPEESQKFWPLYNEMNKKLKEAKRERMFRKKMFDVESKSDKEIIEKCDKILQAELNMALIKKDYFNRFKKILPAKKVFRLLHVERDFQRKLLGKIGCRHRHGQTRGGDFQDKK
jgi:hypothetical protein